MILNFFTRGCQINSTKKAKNIKTNTMKRQEIENKDQELIKKFRTIIQNKEKPPAPKKFPLGYILLSAALIISILLLLKQQPAVLFSKPPKTSPPKQAVLVPAEQPALNKGIVQVEPPLDVPKVPPPTKPEKEEKQVILKSPGSDLNTQVLEKKPPVQAPIQSLGGKTRSGVQIDEIISCTRVNNRQCSSPKLKFSLSQGDTPKTWMKVISKQPPFTLTHVYYVNGQKYCEVPLAISYRHMRTWSSVTLRSFDHIGRWRVEVIDDSGAKLDQIEFEVVE